MSDAPPSPQGSIRGPRRATIAVALAALCVLAAAFVAKDLVGIRNSALAARTALASGLEAVAAGDLAAARGHLAEVDRHLRAAEDGTDGLVWRTTGALPPLSDTVETAEVTLDTARAATDVATVLAGHLGELTRPDGTTRIRDAEGNLDLGPVRDAAAGVAALRVEPLAEALDRLASAPDDGVLEQVADGRSETLREGHRLLSLARDGRQLASVLPSFLGLEEPREYFLAMQNVAEGRGTGGLIGFFATIRVSEGHIELTRPERYEVLDQVRRTGETPPVAPETLPAGFLERYGQFDPTTFLANANLDPNLPTVADVLLNLYEAQRGRRLDGVIAMDPLGLAYAHAAVGPVQLPDATPRGGIPQSIPPSALARVLMIDAYDALGGPSQERKVFLAQVAETAFRNITSGQWSALTMTRWLSQAASAGHLQLYSEHPDEQATFEGLGLAGNLGAPEGHDLLAITFNNSGGNKMDVHVGHTIAGVVTLAPDGDGGVERTAELEVTVENPLPTTGRDIYIIGTHKPNLGFVEAFTDEAGLNRTWFTVWAPDSTTAASRTDEDGVRDDDPQLQRLHGLVALDHVLETPSESTRSFGATVRGPVPTTDGEDGLTYRLRLHRQSKGIPDRLDLHFAAADGWRLVPLALEGGGGEDPMFGVHGAVGPRVVVEPGERGVRVHGDMTRPVDLTLRLVPDGD